MPLNARPWIRAARLLLPAELRQPQTQRAFLSSGGKLPGGTPGEASEQAVPLGPYYDAILNRPQPVPEVKPEEPPTSSPKSPRRTTRKTPAAEKPDKAPKDTPAAKATTSTSTSTTTTTTAAAETASSAPAPAPSAEPATAQEKARIIFGSQLAGPIERAERLASIRDRSTRVAGVLVPPRPEEPDNCCMSGCVNCVWERYRDDVETWASASAEAEKALLAQQQQQQQQPTQTIATEPPGSTGALSVDEDGGGSEANWRADMKKADRPRIAKDLWDDDLYKNVPVGIREFMKQEKRLKEKHTREGTFGA